MAAPRNQLLVGDARTCLADFPDECIDLTITSPPYNIGTEYEGEMSDRRSIDDWRDLMAEVVNELFRVTVPDGKLCLNVAASFASDEDGRYQRVPLRKHLVELCQTAGFDFVDEIAWVKQQYATHGDGALLGSYPYPTNIPITQRHEYILVFHKYVSPSYHAQRDYPDAEEDRRLASKLTNNEWREYAQSIWELPRVTLDVETNHPAIFPLELPRRLIALYSFVDDLVLDPFVGTGSTAVAAQRTGRDYAGIDISKSYIETARQRLGTAPATERSEMSSEPSTPDDIAQYIIDALNRQDPSELRQIRDYAEELAVARETVPEDVIEQTVSDSERLSDVLQTHNGAIVIKKIPCGKENCSTCPHGPYKYRIYRDETGYETEYLGAVDS